MNEGSDKMITVSEAAEILDITSRSVLAAISRDRIEAVKFGKRTWALSRVSVLEYKSNRAPTGPGRGKEK
ncbi:hypothetical protein LCGC14_2308440 [marine sediment metagenome]|uniref:Helix-turn-helix domain-containing protein n=1 Tax=marine sediment metagenome TaxID=412755 RepID=A0A0F9CLB9_9ZZZZ